MAAIGTGVTGVTEGEKVLLYGPWGCERCYNCSRGAINACENAKERKGHGVGLGFDGGLAEYVRVPNPRYLVPIGDLDPVAAASLTDVALTPYHAIKPMLGRLRAGAGVVVIGVGRLGHTAIQVLRAVTSARILAVDVRDEAVKLAKWAGADAALNSKSATIEEILAEVPGNGGAQFVLDFVGNGTTTALAAQLLGTSGEATIVGVGGGTMSMGFGNVPLEATATVPNWGTLPELHEVVALAQAGSIGIETTTMTLDDAIDGYRRLRKGEILGRAVVQPAAS